MSRDDEKRALRQRAQATRAAAFSERAAALVAANFPLERVRPGDVVAGTVAMRAELDPLPTLQRLVAERGAALALPRTPRRGLPLTFHRWALGDALERGAFGVSEPSAGSPVVTPSVLLVPLLAFDATRARLGYGGGYYDRTVAALRAQGPLFAVGLAFAAQEVEVVPTEPHDERLDAVVTERGIVW